MLYTLCITTVKHSVNRTLQNLFFLDQGCDQVRVFLSKDQIIKLKQTKQTAVLICRGKLGLSSKLRLNRGKLEVKLTSLSSGGSRISRRGGAHLVGGAPTPDAPTFRKICMSKRKNWVPGGAPGAPPWIHQCFQPMEKA